MILVFIILGIIIFISLITLILILSNIKLEIKKLHISNEQKGLNVDFVLNIALYFLNKLKFISIKIDDEKIKDLFQKGKIDIQKLKDNKEVNKEALKILKYVDFKIEYFKLEGNFATFNTVLSSSIYAFLQAVIPIIIAQRINGKYINNVQFININQNIININLNCIISVKMVNIINILHYLKKKGGKNNNGKSSDRRSYAYCNE